MKKIGLTLVLAGLLLALGCGSGSKSEPYVIGGIFSITGPASYLGEPERNSMEMVAEEINAKGGINGHPLKLVIYDDEGDVTKARLHAEKLLQKDKALAIVGPSITPASMTVLEVTQKAKMPLISCAAAAGITAPAKDRFWTFKTAQTDEMAVGRIYQYCQKNGIAKVAIIGKTVVDQLYPDSDPVGQTLIVRNIPFKVVGVLQAKGGGGFGNQDDQILVPITTAMARLSRARSSGGAVVASRC